MQLVLTITGENGEQLGRDARRVFGNEGGIIGRGNGSTWRLPDPTNTLSACHATIAHNGRLHDHRHQHQRRLYQYG